MSLRIGLQFEAISTEHSTKGQHKENSPSHASWEVSKVEGSVMKEVMKGRSLKTVRIRLKINFNILFKTWNFVTIVIHWHSHVTLLHRPLLPCLFHAREDYMRKFVTIYGAETWTLRAVDQKHLESFEMWCWRRMEEIC
jgi:hypothetical protein